jgi:2-amino-4-hydroxy-6-hydroxymethyldihydropteridine diphosphokinase
MVSNIYLGLGSNIGEREKYILNAIEMISQSEKCEIKKVSSLYETTPYGAEGQENYLNAAAEICSEFSVTELFTFVKLVEERAGRKKTDISWAPREIDVDILFYNNLIYSDDKLTVPHKEILLRDFVIVPLIEIAAGFVHPVIKKRLNEFDLAGIETHIIRKYDFSTNQII